MKILSVLLLMAFFIVNNAHSQSYNYHKIEDIELSKENIEFTIEPPVCWANQVQSTQCNKRLDIYLSDSTEIQNRKAYKLSIHEDGLVQLSAETKLGLFNWYVFEGRIQNGCKTSCSFSLPAKLVSLNAFKIWYSGKNFPKVSINNKNLAPAASPNYPYIEVKNPFQSQKQTNLFRNSNAKSELVEGCLKNIKDDKVCQCFTNQVLTNTNIQKLLAKIEHDYNNLLVNDLYVTLKDKWWIDYMEEPPKGKKDMKGQTIFAISLNAGFSCLELENQSKN